MSGASWIVLGVAAAYLVACLVLGTMASTKGETTTTGWVAGDRSLGLVLMYFITGATIFSAFA